MFSRPRQTVVFAIVGISALSAVSWAWTRGDTSPNQLLTFHRAVRTDLPIILTEPGMLESQQQTILRCEVATLGGSSGGGGGSRGGSGGGGSSASSGSGGSSSRGSVGSGSTGGLSARSSSTSSTSSGGGTSSSGSSGGSGGAAGQASLSAGLLTGLAVRRSGQSGGASGRGGSGGGGGGFSGAASSGPRGGGGGQGGDSSEIRPQIIWIVPNGKSVTTGELLLELDAAPIQARLNDQVVVVERTKAETIQAAAQYENQKTQNTTEEAEALLSRDLAQLNLQMFGGDEGGTYKIALQTVDLRIQEAKSMVAQTQANVQLQKRERDGMQQLFDTGYRGRGDLEQATYELLQAEDLMKKAQNTLNTTVSARRRLVQYESEMVLKTLQGDLATSERSLQQVQVDNASLLSQALAAKNAADATLLKEQEKLDRYRLLIAKCKVVAPHDGMAVYAVDDGEVAVGEGMYVYERQQLFTLPNLSSMQVKTSVHESVLLDMQPGLAATVRLDAFPDRQYRGSVKTVSSIPKQSSWLSSEVKIYEAIVTIDEPVSDLKPGMTAVVEIALEPMRGVLTVPVQSVVMMDQDSWCYVQAADGVERRTVRVGRTNNDLVQVLDGLNEGDNVVFNPLSVMDPALSVQRTISPDPGGPLPDSKSAAAADTRTKRATASAP